MGRKQGVLILIVVDDGLVRGDPMRGIAASKGLNPCCSGQWSRTQACPGCNDLNAWS